MKFSYFYFLLISVFFLSCTKDDEQLPLSFLEGTYEKASENTDTNIWYVNQYVFKLDGTYETFQFLRNSEDGPNLGVAYYSKGTYTLRGEDFVLNRTDAAGVNFEEFPEGYAPSLAELDPIDVSGSAPAKGTLSQLENGEKISILFECNDMLSENNTLNFCIGAQEFVKVD
ncbi:hypothetical protein [Algoriphagus litoralis]|uniref:hypothetical protein n=1 Tax=Algoriphagus litoralis TaxID=2202829 RepID=UPI000DB999F3|nr:hypothetical protein [Algoriphagus litoralis]